MAPHSPVLYYTQVQYGCMVRCTQAVVMPLKEPSELSRGAFPPINQTNSFRGAYKGGGV